MLHETARLTFLGLQLCSSAPSLCASGSAAVRLLSKPDTHDNREMEVVSTQQADAYMCELSEGSVKLLQRAPCGLDNQSSDTVTTQEEQEQRLMFMAVFVDAKVRAEVLHDTAASSFMEELLQNKSMVVAVRDDVQ